LKPYILVKIESVTSGNAYQQTIKLFTRLEPLLKQTIRTWVYLKDIDVDYNDMVLARNEVFDRNNLVPETNFITSTAIGLPKSNFFKNEFIQLFALIVPDLKQEDLIYMSNEDIMPNTSTYGVRFERGVIFKNYYIISGTASIDKNGLVKYVGEIEKQTYHALDNIDKLLLKYNQTVYNTKEILGYVRNKKDITVVKEICNKKLHNIKCNIIEGKVCRPEWLVEFETMFEGK